MSRVELDMSELLAFGRDLSRSGTEVLGKVRPVIAKGALNVKNAMCADMQGSRHFEQVARSITYDTKSGAVMAEAEVGPVTEGRTVGDLAHLAYFGGVNSGARQGRPGRILTRSGRPCLASLLAVSMSRTPMMLPCRTSSCRRRVGASRVSCPCAARTGRSMSSSA